MISVYFYFSELCRSPPSLDHGTFQVLKSSGKSYGSNYYAEGTRLLISCNQGYRLQPRGSGFVSCSSSGDWSTDSWPICTGKVNN